MVTFKITFNDGTCVVVNTTTAQEARKLARLVQLNDLILSVEESH